MLKQLYADNASTTLAATVAPTDTTILVASTTGFPVPGANQFFSVTIDSGTSTEIISVFGVSGGAFTNCLRGQGTTVAQNFQAGTLIENRLTAEALEQFSRYQDRLADIASVDALLPPNASDGNSYICAATDDSGTPVVAVDKNGSVWRFVTYATVALSGVAAAGSTTTVMNFANASTKVVSPTSGVYIIQFISGVNQGYARAVTNSSSTGITWATPLPAVPAANDSFEVYQSTSSTLNSLVSTSTQGLIFSILFSD